MTHRNHPAEEVYVTGTFDDWAKSVKLEKKGDSFEKSLELSKTDEKIFYKVRWRRCISIVHGMSLRISAQVDHDRRAVMWLEDVVKEVEVIGAGRGSHMHFAASEALWHLAAKLGTLCWSLAPDTLSSGILQLSLRLPSFRNPT